MAKMNAAQKREMENAARFELAVQNFLVKTETMRQMPVINSRADAWKLPTAHKKDEMTSWLLADAISTVEDLTQELGRVAEDAERMAKDLRRMLETRRIDSSRPMQSRVADTNVIHQRLVDAIKFGRMVAGLCNVHVPMFHDAWETEQRELRLRLDVMQWGDGFVISTPAEVGDGRALVTEWQGQPVGDGGKFPTRVAAVRALAEICGSRL